MHTKEQNIELEQRVSNQNKDHLIATQETNIYVARSALMAAVFTFMSNIAGIGKYVAHLAQFLFPALFATEALEAAINAEALRTAKNKNMGKWWDFLFSSGKAGVVGFVVFGIPAAIITATVGHFIFLAVMASLFLYHAGSAIYNIHKWRTTDASTPEGKALEALYAANIKKHLIITAMTAILVTIVAVVIVFAPAILPGIGTVVAIAGAVVLTAGLIYGLYKLGSYLKGRWAKAKKQIIMDEIPEENSENQNSEKKELIKSQSVNHTNTLNVTSIENFRLETKSKPKAEIETGFFYKRSYRSIDLAKSDTPENKVAFLFSEGLKKICDLDKQITEDKSFFKRNLWDENSKRKHKKEMLYMLLGTLASNTINNEDTFIKILNADAIGKLYMDDIKGEYSKALSRQQKNPEGKNPFDLLAGDDVYKLREKNGAYQSFRRNVGDVQDFADAVEKFFKPGLNEPTAKLKQT